MKRGARRVPLWLTAAAVLLLLGVVAVASSGSTPAGSSDTRPPGTLVVDTIFSLFLVLLVPAAALLVYGLAQRKAISRELATGRYPRLSYPLFIGLVLLYTAALSFVLHKYEPGTFTPGVGDGAFSDRLSGLARTESGENRNPEFQWIPVLVLVGVAAAAAFVFWLSARRRRQQFPETGRVVAEKLADLVDGSLDDLRSEADSRRAVVAAYARLEHALAASGLPRRRHETAEELVPRILDELDVDPRPVRRLTDLYELAKFSQHDVSSAMKDQAIDALVEIRDELREAARRDEEAVAATSEAAVP
jgi:hypothetical protein